MSKRQNVNVTKEMDGQRRYSTTRGGPSVREEKEIQVLELGVMVRVLGRSVF